MQPRKAFGARKGHEHCQIVFDGRCRAACQVIDRTSSTIFIELAEVFLLPYAFQLSLESGEHFMCEVKSQRGGHVVATVVGTSPLFSGGPTGEPRVERRATPRPDDYERWTGFRRNAGFKI